MSADAASLVARNNGFAIDLYRQVASKSEAGDNLLLSPLSISAALGMTFAGARGRTAEQMADVLRFTLPDDRLHAAFGELLGDLGAERDAYQLSIANRLFGQAGYPFKQPFQVTTARHYDAPLEAVDFQTATEASRLRINDWVEEQTHDKIRNLLPEGSLNDRTRLVLTNAVYFNGSWKHKFDESMTDKAPFFTGGDASPVAMMRQ